jgi:hypothetical protein
MKRYWIKPKRVQPPYEERSMRRTVTRRNIIRTLASESKLWLSLPAGWSKCRSCVVLTKPPLVAAQKHPLSKFPRRRPRHRHRIGPYASRPSLVAGSQMGQSMMPTRRPLDRASRYSLAPAEGPRPNAAAPGSRCPDARRLFKLFRGRGYR